MCWKKGPCPAERHVSEQQKPRQGIHHWHLLIFLWYQPSKSWIFDKTPMKKKQKWLLLEASELATQAYANFALDTQQYSFPPSQIPAFPMRHNRTAFGFSPWHTAAVGQPAVSSDSQLSAPIPTKPAVLIPKMPSQHWLIYTLTRHVRESLSLFIGWFSESSKACP